MAETIREMVVRLSMDAGAFKKTASTIKSEIRNVDKEIRAIGDASDAKVKLLNDKLGLQKKAVDNFKGAVEQARKNLENADTAAKKLLAAKKLSGLESDLRVAEQAAKDLENQIKRVKFDNLEKAGGQIKGIGRKMSMYITAPLAALGGISYKNFKDQESAMISLQKTVDETDTTKYDDIAQAFKSMSENEVPASYSDLLALGGSFGAKGVATDNIVKFTRAMVDMGEAADDLNAERAGTAMAEILNITERGDFSNVERVSSAVVDLGNNMNATEGEILDFAKRMATDGALVGMATHEILGLASGFVSVGIEAEAGGTASGKVMKKMQEASELGSKAMKAFAEETMTAGMSIRDIQLSAQDGKWLGALAESMELTKKEAKKLVDSAVLLEQFSDVMNVSPQQFIADWDAGAAESVLTFFRSLDQINQAEGEDSLLSTLSDMGMTEVRMARLIQAAALNPDLFDEALSRSEKAYNENIALSEEAEKRYASVASQEAMRLNKMENASADVGDNVADALTPVLEKIANVIGKFGELDEATQGWIVNAGLGLAVGGPLLVGLGSVMQAVGTIGGMFISTGAQGAAGLGMILGPLGALVAWVAAAYGIYQAMEGSVAALDTVEQAISGDKLPGAQAAIDGAQEMTPELEKANEQLAKYRELLKVTNSEDFSSNDTERMKKALGGLSQEIQDEMFQGLDIDQVMGPGSNIAYFIAEYKSQLETEINAATGDAAGGIETELSGPIASAVPGVQSEIISMGQQLAVEAATQAAAVSAAWNAGLNFNTPTVGSFKGGPGSNGSSTTVNINGTPGTPTGNYAVVRQVTDAVKRVNRGYGKG